MMHFYDRSQKQLQLDIVIVAVTAAAVV